MLSRKRIKNDPLSKNSVLNRSIRAKSRRKRVNDQVHVRLQDRLEKEMKIRDGAARLIGACTHESQLLEAAKTLHTSNARTLAYITELQKLKTAEVMEAISDDPGQSDASKVCQGRIALSDIRVPLIWRDLFNSNKSKDTGRHAIFCLISVGSEVQDTELVCVDRASTDIAFKDIVVFEDASYDFKIAIDVFACPMSTSNVSAPTPQKLISRLNRSVGKTEGKRIREHMKENLVNGVKNMSPIYTKIASSYLSLGDISDTVKSHDLELNDANRGTLPLYESMTCRLAAQPKCVTDISLSGFLHMLHMVGASPNWSYLWCEVKAGAMKGWKNPEDCATKPLFTIDLMPKDVKVNEIEKSRQKRPHSFQVRDVTDRHLFSAENDQDLTKWIKGLRQHRNDHCFWGIAFNHDISDRTPMYIASPSPRKVPSDLMFESGIRKTLIYDQLGIDSPLREIGGSNRRSSDVGEAINGSNNFLTKTQTVLLESQTTVPWAGFFTGLNSKPAKIIRKTDLQHHKSTDIIMEESYKPNSYEQIENTTLNCTTSKLDDAFSLDVDNRFRKYNKISDLKSSSNALDGGAKKKRRAPTSPWDEASRGPLSQPPPKPPLPKLPPKQKSVERPNLSTASSIDEGSDERSHIILPSIRSCTHVDHKQAESKSINSLRLRHFSDDKPVKEVLKRSDRVWANEKNCVMPAIPAKLYSFDRSKSLDSDGFQNRRYGEPDCVGLQVQPCLKSDGPNSSILKCKPPKLPVHQSQPNPRRSYLAAVDSSKINSVSNDDTSQHEDISYRRLHYDVKARVYCQAKPPPLPPKLKKASSFPTENKPEEPIYAEIDRVKKQNLRECNVDEAANANAKLHLPAVKIEKKN